MRKSNKYWESRQAQRMFEYMQSAEETAAQVSQLYYKSTAYINAQVETIFTKYKTKHGLSESEARILLNSLKDPNSLDELRQVLQNSTDDAEKAELLAELESPAYRARLEHMEQLQKELDRNMQQVYHQEKRLTSNHYVDLAQEAYYKSIYDIQQRAGFGFSFAHIDPKAINTVIHSKWSGENYSSRIWKNTQALAQDLKQELLVDLVTGRTERETAEIIGNKFAQGASNARRLVRTESCNLSNQMQMQAYEECGIDTYIFVAILDLRTSSQCRKLDGKRFPVSEQQPGKNCPPMHPWCRSTTICDITDEELAQMERAARDPETGKTEMVPANMTYEEWYQKKVEGHPLAEANEKIIQNRSSDKRQFKDYQKIIGNDMPKTLEEFQKMKYTDSEKWDYTKGLKEYIDKYPTSDKRYYDVGAELKRLGVTKALVLPPVKKQAFILPEGKHDPYHIMHRMAERHLTDDEIRNYMMEADIMLVQWGGQRQTFYSNDGACVITRSGENWIYKTAWKREDYDEDTVKILEVIKKYVK